MEFIIHLIDKLNHLFRVSKHKKFELKLHAINFPVKLDKIPKFVKLNNININVFGYDEKFNLYPLQILQNNYEKSIDLLSVTNDNNNHYCWIKNFSRLVSK